MLIIHCYLNELILGFFVFNFLLFSFITMNAAPNRSEWCHINWCQGVNHCLWCHTNLNIGYNVHNSFPRSGRNYFCGKGMPTRRGIKLVTKNIDVMKHGVWIHAWLIRIRENSKDSIAHYEMFKTSPLVFTISHFCLFAKSTWGRLHMTW